MPKPDGIRVIINMGHPENGATTQGGDPVLSTNELSQLHPPAGVDRSDWRHPGEPKPTVADRCHNEAILATLGRAAELPVYKLILTDGKCSTNFIIPSTC